MNLSQSAAFLNDMNEEQLAAVTAPFDKPLFIHAGAGSGKTRTLICRISHMINNGIPPDHILAITFTRKAADEIRERLSQFIGPRARDINTSTFHQLCLSILKQHPQILNFAKNEFHVADPAIQRKIIKSACMELITKNKSLNSNLPNVLRIMTTKMLNFVRKAKNKKLKSTDFQNDLEFVLRYYENAMKARKLIDFNDFLTHTESLLLQFPQVANEYRKIYEYILIDEFQDTAIINFSIIKLILGKSQKITIVGDTRQSIYSFRGANSSNISTFLSNYPNALSISLNQNYRSTQTILNAAQSLISKNKEENVDFSSPLVSHKSKGELVEIISAEDPLAEVDTICSRIEMLVHPGSVYQYRDIVIMFRIRKISADIEMELFRRNIPYTHKRGIRFFMRREVREVISYAKLILSFNDNSQDPNLLLFHAIETIINVPDRGIGTSTIPAIRDNAGCDSTLYYLRNLKDGDFGKTVTNRLRKFVHEIGRMHNQIIEVNDKLATDVIISTIIEMSKLLEEESRDEDAKDNVEAIEEINDAVTNYYNDRKETLDLLVEEAARFHQNLLQSNSNTQMTSRSCLQKFVNTITLESSSESSQNAVTLSTIHQMKGLESSICFLMRFNQGVLPLVDSNTEVEANGLESITTIEEERRIAYVAMTRAKDRLFISYVKSSRGRAAEPSMFLPEIDNRCLTMRKKLTKQEEKEISKIMDFVDDDFDDFDI